MGSVPVPLNSLLVSSFMFSPSLSIVSVAVPFFKTDAGTRFNVGSPEPHVRTRFCYMGVQNLGAGL